MTNEEKYKKIIQRAEVFWSLVDKSKPDGCWLWKGIIGHFGYGYFSIYPKMIGAHRMSWTLAHDRVLTPKEYVCHHCDNPPCVNPSHLFVGDQKANITDMISKGRNSRGASHSAILKATFNKLKEQDLIGFRRKVSGRVKLSEDDVRLIRSLVDVPQKELAARFNVHPNTIWKVRHRNRWDHII
jgi:hypothetical protein